MKKFKDSCVEGSVGLGILNLIPTLNEQLCAKVATLIDDRNEEHEAI
jgi:hypothetical protein